MKQIVFQLAFIILLFTLSGMAQQPAPSATPPGEETIKISTEEIYLNVMARSTASGQFVPTLKIDDLLVVEDGTPQEITNLQRVPASVLLMLDTGADLNYIKNLNATQMIAEIFVRSLPPNNALSVMQYYDKIETVSDWNNDYNPAVQALENKLFTGKRSRLTEALYAAVESFRSRPLENRHLVLITDGVETVADEAARQKALQNLLGANITVHVISYTRLEEQRAQKATRLFRPGDGKTKPRIDPLIYEQILRGLEMGQNNDEGKSTQKLRARLKSMNESQAIVIVNLDRERTKRVQEKLQVWRKAETELQALANDTGGVFQAPEELDTMLRLAGEIAKAVDSQYVITYIPKKTLANQEASENRRVRVSTHCEGVEIQARQKIVINSR